MLESIKVENLRSIEDSGFVKIKPLTVLVGRNSCGKSTFARTFPLLRQSAEEKTRSALLWFGRYVDFGSFGDAVKSGKDEITFTFRIEVKHQSKHFFEDQQYLFFEEDFLCLDDGKIDCSITVSQSSSNKIQHQYIKKIEIMAFGNKMVISASQDSSIYAFKVNDEELYLGGEEDSRSFLSGGSIIPKPRFLKKQKRRLGSGDKRISILVSDTRFNSYLFSFLQDLAHKNTHHDTIYELIEGLGIGEDKSIKKQLESSSVMGGVFKSRIKEVDISSKKFKKIKNLIYATKIEEIIGYIDSQIKEFFLGVRYIEPLRATAERYYRVQDLAVDEIDPRGSNIAMYIKNLSDIELKAFNDWCNNALNFTVDYDDNPGHMALKIVEGGFDRNITDMGFGYSQLLPIAMHLWSSCINNTRKRRLLGSRKNSLKTIVIEQPELHLHPAFQAKIADIFSAVAANSKENNSAIVVETHSSHLINRLGQLVDMGKVDPDDIQVILFERDIDSDTTNIRTTTFDSEGFLVDWPIGFLQPEA